VTSQAIDESKADIYAEAGVAEYWLVRPDDRTVELSSGGFSSPKTFRWIRMSPTFWR
jgi:Uma2 family endonuclease